MKRVLPLREKIAPFLIKHRWLLLMILAAAALLFEIAENLNINDPLDIHLVHEVLFFGGIYPLIVFWLLHNLFNIQAKRNSLAWQRKQEQRLSQKLGQAKTPLALGQAIVAFPESIAPFIGTVLYRPSPETGEMRLVEERWLGNSGRPLQLLTTLSNNFCDAAAHLPDRGLHPLLTRPYMTDTGLKGYCLPLLQHHNIVALLHLYLPLDHDLMADQIELLNFTAPTIALALDATITPAMADLQAAATRQERERIARHLHDTLGHKLAYLQIKVDQLTSDNTLMGITTIQQDLERIRDISNEAYEQVRETILNMKAESLPQLMDALMVQAEAVAQQANLELHFDIDGQPHPLPPLVERKILFICREALNNVQRHAYATTLELCVNWTEDTLIINIRDNGLGFDPRINPEYGHFGMLIMGQRAIEIKSELSITSAPGRGTHIRLGHRFASL